jgi:transcriptional regulator with XRE-family HTH domain
VAGKSVEAFRPIGARLAELRKEAGLTQRALASRLNKPPSFVAKLERAERRLDILDVEALANALGLEAARVVERLLGH